MLGDPGTVGKSPAMRVSWSVAVVRSIRRHLGVPHSRYFWSAGRLADFLHVAPVGESL